MAFSVKMVKSILSSHNMPVDDLDAAAEEICARHSADFDSIKEERDALRTERDTLKKDTETLASVQKELAELKGNPDENYKARYEQEKKDFADYKAQVAGEKALEAKKTALREIAKDANLSDAGIAKAVKYTDYSKIELDDKGVLKGKADILKSLKEEWPEYLKKTDTDGADISNPPTDGGNGAGKKTKEEILAIKDTAARQAAMVENHELFGY
jgi:hypothetical protein